MKTKTLLTLTTALMITLPAAAMAGDQNKWDSDYKAEKQTQMQDYKTMDKSASAMDESMDQSEMGMSADVKPQQHAKAQWEKSQKKTGEEYSQATIRDLQKALSERGYDAGPVDGIWGPKTASAVRNFQQARNMPMTRELNDQTLNELGVQAEMRERMMQRTATRMQKDTIQDIQKSLRQAGFNPGPVDGIWGPKTASAVRDFQQKNNLEATGNVNQSTLEQLGVETRG